MSGSKSDDAIRRAEYLINLRHGIRQATRLGEELVSNPLVGCEVRALVGRLQSIRAELDDLARLAPHLPPADNDPVWGQMPRSFSGSSN